MRYLWSGWLLTLALAAFEASGAGSGERLAGEIFVNADSDRFDPGIAIGATFPRISALYDAREVTDLVEFTGEAGLVIVTNRSVDW